MSMRRLHKNARQNMPLDKKVAGEGLGWVFIYLT